MTDIPIEFRPETVRENSPKSDGMFHAFNSSGGPMAEVLAENPWLAGADLSQPLEWGDEKYWDTTVARKHPYWKDKNLPQPSKDIRQLRKDFLEWGYCLIHEGLSEKQVETLRNRVLEQAAAERKAGIELTSPHGQMLYSLINKGECFVKCIEFNQEAIQAGPIVEQLLTEALGKGFICHSFVSNGASLGGYPQMLHMDQGPITPFNTFEAPALVNTMFIIEDVSDENGGTLFIPGSHKQMAEWGRGRPIGKMLPTINLEAKAGTVFMFDGRMLHGTGVNRTERRRYVTTMSNIRPWMRPQENWILVVDPDVLKNASSKLLQRIGLQATFFADTVEGFGMFSRGFEGEDAGNLKFLRDAYDEGRYLRVGPLGPKTSVEELKKRYTVPTLNKKFGV